MTINKLKEKVIDAIELPEYSRIISFDILLVTKLNKSSQIKTMTDVSTPKKAKLTPMNSPSNIFEEAGYLHRVHSVVKNDKGNFFKFCFFDGTCNEGTCWNTAVHNEFLTLCNDKTPVMFKAKKQLTSDMQVKYFNYTDSKPPKILQTKPFEYEKCGLVKWIAVEDVKDMPERTKVWLKADVTKKIEQVTANSKLIDIYLISKDGANAELKVWEPTHDLKKGSYEIRGMIKTFKEKNYLEVCELSCIFKSMFII